MIKEFTNEAMKRLMNQLITSTNEVSTRQNLTMSYSGVYEKADVCHRLLLDKGRNYIFEPHNSYLDMQKAQIKSSQIEFNKCIEDFETIFTLAKKSHFVVFNQQNITGLKSVADIFNKSYLYIPLERFCKHIVSFKSSLGMNPIEIMLYFKFLDDYPNAFNIDQSYVVNLYKNTRISVFTLQEAQLALNGLLDINNLDQPMDLSITQRLS
ncbi:MAG: hypothetical protein KDI92_09345 [Xanthomonadales bacterium]|nr:hypothetical protein [Xanthomonadales bacterium]